MITWLLAFVGGFIAYLVIDHLQTTMERHNVITDIENKINDLFSNKIAKSKKDGVLESVMIRTILHDFTDWEYQKDMELEVIDGQRFISVRQDDKYVEFISTQALHESLILFRRIEKLYKSKIIKSIDLSDLWRELIPFGSSRRLQFFEQYYSQRDIESITYVIMETVLACNKHKNDTAVNYFIEHYNKQRDEVKSFYFNNTRIRFIDRYSLYKFKRLVK
jgi:hypothetical protein